jgi:hypothetical protein
MRGPLWAIKLETMNKYILTFCIFLQLFICQIYCQVEYSFVSDSNFAEFYPEIITAPNYKIPETFDFQLRVWYHGATVVPAWLNLLILTSKDGKWLCQTYRFSYKAKNKLFKKNNWYLTETKVDFSNLDTLWLYLTQNDILFLPNMENIQPCIEKGENGESYEVKIDDGLDYTFELLSPSNHRSYNYHCPKTIMDHCPNIIELKKVVLIIEKINELFGMDKSNIC